MMRALSFTQPWLYATLHLGKGIDNRTLWRGCSYRGPVLLHASASVGNRADFDGTVRRILTATESLWAGDHLGAREFAKPFAKLCYGLRGMHPDESVWRPTSALPLGGIVGRAVIDGVIACEADMAAYCANAPDGQRQRAWWFGGFALVLKDVQPLPFTPWKGALGLWSLDESKVLGR